MCGIVGYIGTRQATEICVAGLKRLEYRGYDSAGIAVVVDGELEVVKVVGKLAALADELEETPLDGTLGIGHTRWATHGKPSKANSHPHVSGDGRIALVHNGIIENYAELRDQLQEEGFEFVSETDTEVIVHRVDRYYEGDLAAAFRRAVQDLEGAFAVGIVCADAPDQMVAARRFSPLVVGIGDGENWIASDMGAVREWTDQVYIIDDDEMAVITRDGIELTDFEGNPVAREPYTVPWPADAAQKGGHKHFMHKEIHEQPRAMRECLLGRLTDPEKAITLEGLNMTEEEIRGLRKVVFTACGTAFAAGLGWRFLME